MVLRLPCPLLVIKDCEDAVAYGKYFISFSGIFSGPLFLREWNVSFSCADLPTPSSSGDRFFSLRDLFQEIREFPDKPARP